MTGRPDVSPSPHSPAKQRPPSSEPQRPPSSGAQQPSSSGAQQPSSSGAQRLRWLAFGAAVAAAAMDLLDSTIAQVAAPSIHRDLGGSVTVIQWVTAAYALAMAVGLLTGGRLGDQYGRKRVLLAGLAAFSIASAVCAAAVSPGELIAARAAQGAAGAIMVP